MPHASRSIVVRLEQGSAEGVLHHDAARVASWLQSDVPDPSPKEITRGSLDLPVAILKNVNVDEAHRGRGIGTRLLNEFLDKGDDARTVLLVCDLQETNNFNLRSWYEGFGFEVVPGHDQSFTPVMVRRQG